MSAQVPTPPSRLDAEPVSRRDFLGTASLGAAALALAATAGTMLRLPKAAVSATPSKKFRVVLPETLPAGEPFVPPGRPVALFREGEEVWAISLVCTHLGCIVKAKPGGFECPCHGSRFSGDGSVARGPAPRPLHWLKVTRAAAGQVIVDEAEPVPPGTRVKA